MGAVGPLADCGLTLQPQQALVALQPPPVEVVMEARSSKRKRVPSMHVQQAQSQLLQPPPQQQQQQQQHKEPDLSQPNTPQPQQKHLKTHKRRSAPARISHLQQLSKQQQQHDALQQQRSEIQQRPQQLLAKCKAQPNARVRAQQDSRPQQQQQGQLTSQPVFGSDQAAQQAWQLSKLQQEEQDVLQGLGMDLDLEMDADLQQQLDALSMQLSLPQAAAVAAAGALATGKSNGRRGGGGNDEKERTGADSEGGSAFAPRSAQFVTSFDGDSEGDEEPAHGTKRASDGTKKSHRAASNSGDEDDKPGRREQRREKNRLAARKCRMKKVDFCARVQEELRELANYNTELKMQVVSWHRMFAREFRMREVMKRVLLAVWDDSSTATTGFTGSDVVISLETGRMDVNNLQRLLLANVAAAAAGATATGVQVGGGGGINSLHAAGHHYSDVSHGGVGGSFGGAPAHTMRDSWPSGTFQAALCDTGKTGPMHVFTATGEAPNLASSQPFVQLDRGRSLDNLARIASCLLPHFELPDISDPAEIAIDGAELDPAAATVTPSHFAAAAAGNKLMDGFGQRSATAMDGKEKDMTNAAGLTYCPPPPPAISVKHSPRNSLSNGCSSNSSRSQHLQALSFLPCAPAPLSPGWVSGVHVSNGFAGMSADAPSAVQLGDATAEAGDAGVIGDALSSYDSCGEVVTVAAAAATVAGVNHHSSLDSMQQFPQLTGGDGKALLHGGSNELLRAGSNSSTLQLLGRGSSTPLQLFGGDGKLVSSGCLDWFFGAAEVPADAASFAAGVAALAGAVPLTKAGMGGNGVGSSGGGGGGYVGHGTAAWSQPS